MFEDATRVIRELDPKSKAVPAVPTPLANAVAVGHVGQPLPERRTHQDIGLSPSYTSRVERSDYRLDLVQLRIICLALGTILPAFLAAFEKRLAGRAR